MSQSFAPFLDSFRKICTMLQRKDRYADCFTCCVGRRAVRHASSARAALEASAAPTPAQATNPLNSAAPRCRRTQACNRPPHLSPSGLTHRATQQERRRGIAPYEKPTFPHPWPGPWAAGGHGLENWQDEESLRGRRPKVRRMLVGARRGGAVFAAVVPR